MDGSTQTSRKPKDLRRLITREDEEMVVITLMFVTPQRVDTAHLVDVVNRLIYGVFFYLFLLCKPMVTIIVVWFMEWRKMVRI